MEIKQFIHWAINKLWSYKNLFKYFAGQKAYNAQYY